MRHVVTQLMVASRVTAETAAAVRLQLFPGRGGKRTTTAKDMCAVGAHRRRDQARRHRARQRHPCKAAL